MKIITIHESKLFCNGVDLGDVVAALPDGAEEIKIHIEEDNIRVTYCVKILKKDKSRR